MERSQFIVNATKGNVNATTGILYGVSMLTANVEAKGHGIWIDGFSLISCMDAANTVPGGIKCKINHGSDVTTIVGVLKTFRIVGDQLLADLHLLPSSPFRSQVIEWATELPNSFGLSIDFSYEGEVINGKKYVRVIDLFSCDVVDSPAANPRGLFARLSAVISAMPKSITRVEFDALNAPDQAKHCLAGGKVHDGPPAARLAAPPSNIEISALTFQADGRNYTLKNGTLTRSEFNALSASAKSAALKLGCKIID